MDIQWITLFNPGFPLLGKASLGYFRPLQGCSNNFFYPAAKLISLGYFIQNIKGSDDIHESLSAGKTSHALKPLCIYIDIVSACEKAKPYMLLQNSLFKASAILKVFIKIGAHYMLLKNFPVHIIAQKKKESTSASGQHSLIPSK